MLLSSKPALLGIAVNSLTGPELSFCPPEMLCSQLQPLGVDMGERILELHFDGTRNIHFFHDQLYHNTQNIHNVQHHLACHKVLSGQEHPRGQKQNITVVCYCAHKCGVAPNIGFLGL